MLQHFIGAEPQQFIDGIVGLQNLAFQVTDKHRIRRILNQAIGVGAGLVQFAHIAQDTDSADHLAL